MVSSCGRYAIAYNGEVYNANDLRAQLQVLGRHFRGHSDTEAIVEAIAVWGVEKSAQRLIGMFAFALWDRQDHLLYLVRDRIEIRPMYWAEFGELILFGSELKALRDHDGWQPELDRQSVVSFLWRASCQVRAPSTEA